MVKLTVDMQAEAEQWQARLATTTVTESNDYLSISVSSSGELAKIRFEEKALELSYTRLSSELMTLYRAAVVRNNRQMASRMPEDVASVIRSSLPESFADAAADFDEANEPYENPMQAASEASQETSEPDRVYTLDDLPPRPESENFFGSFGTNNDPLAGLAEAFESRPFPHSDWERDPENFDENIRSEILDFEGATNELKSRFEAIRGESSGKYVRIEVNSGRALESVRFQPAIRGLELDELHAEFMAAYEAASQDAQTQTDAAIRSVDLDGTIEESLRGFGL